MIDIKEEKDKIAIIVVGYNKLFGLKRLLQSLSNAVYPNSDVPLIISIDASGNEAVYDYALDFEWEHGKKYVNIEKERLGLKKHIFQCASLSRYFKGIILLEDDLFIAPDFYHFSQVVLDKYGKCDKVVGISLYAPESNGFIGLPYQPEQNGSDVLACQAVSSWGEIWNERMWKGFTTWLECWDGDFDSIDMIRRIKDWKRAWSKYYYAYMIQTDKFFIFPYMALSTNFNDAGGEHGGGNNSIVQVSLLQEKRNYQLYDFDKLVKYDVYTQNLEIARWLGLDKNDLTVDFYGQKERYRGRYILAPFNLPYKRVKGFSLSMRPWELNIKYNIHGNDILLYDKNNTDVVIPPKRKFNNSIPIYFFRGYNVKLLLRFVVDRIWEYFKLKMKLTNR